VEIENGTQLYYRVGLLNAPSVTRMEENGIEPEDPVITAFRDDWRHQAKKRGSSKNGEALIAKEYDLMEPLAVVNDSGTGAYYATRKTRSMSVGYNQFALTAVLDKMLEEHAPERPFIAGVAFGELNLMVLYLYGPTGHISGKEAQVSINPYSAESLASSFAAERHLPEDTPAYVFSHEEFVDALLTKPVKPYPRYNTIMGMPPSKVIGMAAAAAWVVALAAGGWAGWNYLQWQGQESKIAQLKQDAQTTESQVGEAMTKARHGLSRMLSIDFETAMAKAAKVKPQGGRVVISLERDTYTLDAMIPLRRSDHKDALEIPSLKVTEKNLSIPAPEGCTATTTEITGGTNEIKKRYTCPGTNWGANHGW
jgi:hypothetical protein